MSYLRNPDRGFGPSFALIPRRSQPGWPGILHEAERHMLDFGITASEAIAALRVGTVRQRKWLAAAEASGDLGRWLIAKGIKGE